MAAREVLEGRGLVDFFEELVTGPGVLARGWRRLRWLLRMRRSRWDLGVVLTPASPPTTLAYLGNLRRYLRLCGAGRILSPGSVLPIRRDSSGALLPMPHVADQMLEILCPLGIPLPVPGQADASLPPLAPEPSCPLRLEPGGRHLAVGCGANMPANLWPLERYAKVLAGLSRRHGVVPVYLGGTADAERCARLQELAPGPILIGRPLGQVEAVMRRCLGYLGKDTGLVHLAAAVGIPCIGVYSNRNQPGLWDPYVPRRGVLRPPPCPAQAAA